MAGASHQAKYRPTTPPQTHRNGSVQETPKKFSTSPSQSLRGSKTSASYSDRQRRSFVTHLTWWSLNHDAGPYFSGKIAPIAHAESVQVIGLGKSVRCVLAETAWTNTKKQVVIRLFPPSKHDSRYRMMIRYGSSWVSAADFLSKEHFKSKKSGVMNKTCSLQRRGCSLGPEPEERDSVIIRPQFLPFLRLPLELQQSILAFAAGLMGRYQPNSDASGRQPHRSSKGPETLGPLGSPISLGTMMRLSKTMNTHIVPWVFRTTDFQFEMTGFTSFLWLCGPQRRAEIKRITFRFSREGLLHCLRWLAPDPIFELFEPPVLTTPPALCFLWRCQLRDLVNEVHLAVLTIDVCGARASDLPMMVRILRHAFGSVTNIRFKHASLMAEPSRRHLKKMITEKRSWRQECCAWFKDEKGGLGRNNGPGVSHEKRALSVGELEGEMDRNRAFFDHADCAWADPCLDT